MFFLFPFLLTSCCEDEEVVVEYWTHADGKRGVLEERLIEEFEKENPTIDVIRTEFSSSELLYRVPSSIEAGEGPVLFNLPSEEISDLLRGGYLDTIPSGLIDQEAYIPDAFNAVTYENHVYGIPLEYTNWCLYVNKSVLDEASLSLPESWEAVASIAAELTEYSDNLLERRVFDFRYPYYLSFFVPMVEQLGGSLIGPDGSYIWNTEAWEKALSFMSQWGPLGNNYGSPTLKNARSLFNEEGIVMCLSGLYQEARMQDINPEFYESGSWCVLPFPVFDDAVSDVSASSYLHFFLVNADRSDKERMAGWKLAAFFAEHADEYLDEVGLVMPLDTVIKGEGVRNKPFGEVFISDLERSHPVYSGEYASEIQKLIGDAVESVMLQGVEPEKAVAALRASVSYLFV